MISSKHFNTQLRRTPDEALRAGAPVGAAAFRRAASLLAEFRVSVVVLAAERCRQTLLLILSHFRRGCLEM